LEIKVVGLMSLTPEQSENWRKVLYTLIGPYASLAPEEEIQRLRDAMQGYLNTKATESETNKDV
jgi:hypothetical protein